MINEHPHRRETDFITEQIEELIMAADDPKDKAFLLILNKIANNLDENTGLTRLLSTDFKLHTIAFEKHEKDEMALINQGRGFWRAALASVFLFQGLAVWWVQGHLDDVRDIAKRVGLVEVEMVKHKEHHKQEEHFFGVRAK